MNTPTQVIHSYPIASLLGIAFVILKLTGYIAWSWWWVLAPFWAPLALFLALLGGVGLCWLAVLAFTAVALVFRKRK